MFRPEPVRIESWVTRIRAASFTMAYEILDELPDGARRVYARARTVLTPYVFTEERPRRIRDEERAVLERFLEPRAAGAGRHEPRTPTTCHVRFSDVDVYGHVNNVKYFEYYQEARIAFILSLDGAAFDPSRLPMRQVVARIDVDYRRPILFRPEPYAVETWVTRIGTSSYDLALPDRRRTDGHGATPRPRCGWSRSTLATQRSRPLDATSSGAGSRPSLEADVSAPAAGSSKVFTMNCAACVT